MNSVEKIKLGIEMNCSKSRLKSIKYRYEILFNINNSLPIDYHELGTIRAEYKNELKHYKLLKKMYNEL